MPVDKLDSQARWHGTRPPSTSPPAKSTLNGASQNICKYCIILYLKYLNGASQNICKYCFILWLKYVEIFPFPFLSSDNFQALRSTNFSRESFVRRRPRTFFIFWLPGFPLMSRTVIWSLGRGPTMPSRWSYAQISIFAKIFALWHIFRHRFPINGTTFIKICRKRDCAKKVPGNISILFPKEKKMMEQTLRSFVFLLAPSQEHMFERKLIKHQGSHKVSFNNRISNDFCKKRENFQIPKVIIQFAQFLC